MPPERERGRAWGGGESKSREVINLHAKPKPLLTFLPLSPVPSSDPPPPTFPASISSNLFPLLGHQGSTQPFTRASAVVRADPCHPSWCLGTMRGTPWVFHRGSRELIEPRLCCRFLAPRMGLVLSFDGFRPPPFSDPASYWLALSLSGLSGTFQLQT